MPTPEFARTLLQEAETWVEEGVVTPEQATTILSRYEPLLDAPPTPTADETRGSRMSAVLYAIAGVLLGAAGVAFIVVGLELTDSALPLAVIGLAFAAAAAALGTSRGWPLLADALAVAAFVPLAVSSFFGDAGEIAGLAAMLVAVGFGWWRQESSFVPPLAIIAFSVSAGAASAGFFDDGFSALWVALQVGLLVGVVASERARGEPGILVGALATVALAVSVIVFIVDTFSGGSSEAAEIAVGLVFLGVLLAGVAAKHRGVVIGAGAVIGVDAIVFAFDVGGVLFGTVLLVGLAGFLIWQAEFLKRYVTDMD